jgi:uncharacterized protein (DUF849 family)
VPILIKNPASQSRSYPDDVEPLIHRIRHRAQQIVAAQTKRTEATSQTMSTSDQTPNRPGTTLTHLSESQPFRLLELPPELQALLDGPAPPM